MNTPELRPGLRSWVAPRRMLEFGADPYDATASIGDSGAVTLAAAVGAHHCGDSDDLAGNEVLLSAVECALADFLGLVRATAAHLRMTDYDLQFVVEWIDRDRPLEFLLPNLLFGGYVEGTPRRETVYFVPVTATLGTDVDDDAFHRDAYQLARDCANQAASEPHSFMRSPILSSGDMR